ncbi:MAG TPA: M6 family metalloprotease domain-containing protein [candidate division Zixibacteria bacterium]|nr:M6 family metalloprotease domain-containing protein [candidate division Zixibacteria bacterium]MDD4918770.1 M6 family metalloprotease domain-containing protein [candidate division Zixibacteria bacterium]MDM7974299.1 M6 family metalloprotease domain-containing protein [candidate division Zixibacteria bacterium]HOD66269.1 M6 family metalloprotease domain-containing protein [candidate division Zixibacteria bacterium]HPM37039.1 M6 family metalloprotease domain-containing protein [candidate divis
MSRTHDLLISLLGLGVAASLGLAVSACPPHPDLLAKIEAGAQPAPYFLAHRPALRVQGVSTGMTMRRVPDGPPRLVPGQPPASGAYRALAVLVQFSDHPSAVPAVYFDSLLFDSAGRSLRSYYRDVSYAQLDIVTLNLPSAHGWRTAPQTYAWYVNNQNALGDYPQNSQRLTEDIVDQIDPFVNFSQYDNNGDGYVDAVILIHSGSGAEKTGSNADIWSHQWAITPRLKDGVYISDFTIQPELWVNPGDMTIGVYAHELGHAFGVPDLYDTDGTQSRGLGVWCLMAYGSWLGPGGMGGSPSHPSAWSRIRMGFAAYTNVTANAVGQEIAAVESGGPIYRLWSGGSPSPEYFLVENRQRTGYDSYLYSSGLFIWHIDETKATADNTDNTQEWWPGAGMNPAEHYRVALEQADGLWELEKRLDYGDAGDPFPGALDRRVFDATTTPNSDSYLAGTSFTKVDNISPSAAVMTADLIVGLAADVDSGDDNPTLPAAFELAQNYPNPFNPSTTISFELSGPMHVTLEIFNIVGQRVRTLMDGPAEAGRTERTWDGCDEAGRTAASGLYLYRLTTGSGSRARKMLLLK